MAIDKITSQLNKSNLTSIELHLIKLYYNSNAIFNTTADRNYNDEYRFQFIIWIIVGIFFSITFFVGLVGNSLVVLTILLNKRMRNSTNILILNLAIADLIFIIFCIPFTGLNYVLEFWYFGKYNHK